MPAIDSMISMRARRAHVGAAALLLAACSGGPERQSKVPLAPGQDVEVTYVDESNRLSLRNASSVDDATYRERGLYGGAAPDVKLADQGSLQALVDALYELGHFDRAAPQMRPGARAAIHLRLGGQVTVWSQPPLQPDHMAELERFNTAMLAFLQVHNNIISYHTGTMSKDDVERAIAEQKEKNRTAVRNLLDKSRGSK